MKRSVAKDWWTEMNFPVSVGLCGLFLVASCNNRLSCPLDPITRLDGGYPARSAPLDAIDISLQQAAESKYKA